MAQLRPSRRRSKRNRDALDDLGGTADGALAVVTGEGRWLHVTPPSVAAALRYLMARVQAPGTDQLPSRLALTSALRGEGVTYMIRSLATVVAYDTDASVVIVDLNWTAPPPPDGKAAKKAAPIDGVGAEPATATLAEAVEDDRPIDEIIVATTNPRLSLISAGQVPIPRRPAMAGSRRLETVINDIAERFDHVLLDLPPVLASSDAITLSQLADAFALVVHQGVTSSNQVEAALEELRGREALGVILNRYDTHIPRFVRRVVGV